MKDFRDKVAAITGAASGIGRSLALALARRGCHLALSDVDGDNLAETAAAAGGHGVRVTTARVNVAERAAVYAWAAQVARDHGRVNLIVNNAGVSLASTVEGMDYADFEWIMGINFWGVVYGTKAFLPYLRASGDGHIVNMSSLFGLFAQPGQSAYNASKFAVRGFTEALRQELMLQGAPVGVTCVHPGGIRTNINRAGRYAPSMRELLRMDEARAKAAFERFLRLAPDAAAQAILRGVERNRARVLIGGDARRWDTVQRLFPAAYQRLLVAGIRRRWRRRPAPDAQPDRGSAG